MQFLYVVLLGLILGRTLAFGFVIFGIKAGAVKKSPSNFREILGLPPFFYLPFFGNWLHKDPRVHKPIWGVVLDFFGLFLALFSYIYWPQLLGWSLFIGLGLTLIFFSDLENFLIPDSLIVFLAGVGLAMAIWNNELILSIMGALMGFLLMGGLSLITWLIYRKPGLGGGDVKLTAVLGLLVGIEGIFWVLSLAFVFGGLVGVLLIVFKIKNRNDVIPFGPFLISGYLFWLFGSFYLGLSF